MATVPALFVIQRMLKFTGRHAGGQFEPAGEVLNRAESETSGNLSKIKLILPDHLSGCVDFEFVEVIYDAAAGAFVEGLFQLGTTNEIVPADLLNRQILVQMLLQISGDLGYAVLRMAGKLSGLVREAVSLADQADQQFFNIGTQQLCAAKGGLVRQGHFMCSGVVQGIGKQFPADVDDVSQQGTLLAACRENTPREKLHGGAVAPKADHHQIGRYDAVCRKRVELSGRMEDELAAGEVVFPVVRSYLHLPLIHIEEFPEIVGFTGKSVAAGVFKVMDGIDLAHFKAALQVKRLIRYGSSPPDAEHCVAKFTMTGRYNGVRIVRFV